MARRAPYRRRVAAWLGTLLVTQLIWLLVFGFTIGVPLVGLGTILVSGLLVDERWAAGAWLASVVVMFGGALLVGTGTIAVYDPETVDPRHLTVGLRFALTYTVSSVVLGLAVWFVIDQLARNLAMTRQALSDLEAAEQKIRESEKLRTIGQLSGGFAHDFNNVLAEVVGSVELALMDLPEGHPEVRGQLVKTLDATDRGASLTGRLMAFARRQPLRPQAIDVLGMIEGLRGLAAMTLGEHITLELSAPPDLWRCEADPNELEKSLVGLWLNARDAMPEGGTVRVVLENLPTSNDGPEGHVRIAIQDSGVGMSPDILEQAIDPFFTTKHGGRGTGLGLSAVHGFVHQSGGFLVLESEVGKGTIVALHLPRHLGVAEDTAQPSARGRVAGASEAPRGHGELVLVVEDEDVVREITCAFLRSLSYRALEADDAPSALRILGTRPDVALVVSDVVLRGGTSGRQLANRVGAVRRELPFLFVSGYSKDELIQGGRLPSGVDLLAKPFSRDALARAVDAVLMRSRRPHQAGATVGLK